MLCSTKPRSMLRDSTPEAVNSFSWEAVVGELKVHTPTLYQLLKGMVEAKRRVRCPKSGMTPGKGGRRGESAGQKGGDDKATKRPTSMAIIGVCAAIILRNKNMHMNLVQHIVSLILNTGHASKQVSLLLQYDYV